MYYQVEVNDILFQNGEGIKELRDEIVDYCLHKRVRNPYLAGFVKVDEDETPLSTHALLQEIHYEIECGWW